MPEDLISAKQKNTTTKRILYVLLVFICSSGYTQNSSSPNIVFIFCDDLNSAGLGLFDDSQAITPYMDTLSMESAVFTNAHANAPLCGPSRASVFTGVHPVTSGYYGYKQLQNNWQDNEVLSEATTIFRHFKSNGYRVFASGKIFHAQQNPINDFTQYNGLPFQGPFPFDKRSHSDLPQAFSQTDISFSPLEAVPSFPEATGWFVNDTLFMFESDEDRDLLGDEITANYCDSVLSFLSNTEVTNPFFLTLGLYSPHGPFHVPQKYFDLYPLDSIDISALDDSTQPAAAAFWNRYNSQSNLQIELLRLESPTDDPLLYLKKFIQGYLASVSFADAQIGAILQSLKNHGFDENTYVVLSSDHGYHLGSKSIIKKSTLWKDATRVPLLIRGPNVPVTEISKAVSLIDVYPTLIDFAGLPQPPHSLDGEKISSVISNSIFDGTVISTPSAEKLEIGELGKAKHQHHAIHFTDYKYILYSSGEDEMYDVRNDTFELHNLSDSVNFQYQRAYLQRLLVSKIGELTNPTPAYQKLYYGDFNQNLNGWKPSQSVDDITIVENDELLPSKHVLLSSSEATNFTNDNISLTTAGFYELSFSAYSESENGIIRMRLADRTVEGSEVTFSQEFLIQPDLEKYSIGFIHPDISGFLSLQIQVITGNGIHLDNVELQSIDELDAALHPCLEPMELSQDIPFSSLQKDTLKYAMNQKEFLCNISGLKPHIWYDVEPTSEMGLLITRIGGSGDPFIERWADCADDTAMSCFDSSDNQIEYTLLDSLNTIEKLHFRIGDKNNISNELHLAKTVYHHIVPAEIVGSSNDSILVNSISYPDLTVNQLFIRLRSHDDPSQIIELTHPFSESGWYDLESADLAAGIYQVDISYRMNPLNIIVPHGPVVSIEIGLSSIGTDIQSNGYSVYPNPMAAGCTEITLTNDIAEFNGRGRVSLHDMNGRKVYQWDKQLGLSSIKLPLSGSLAKGFYFIKIVEDDGPVSSIKLKI